MPEMSVLISGIGIAGPALAHWLQRAGFLPTLVDRAPEVATGGHMIDVRGAGHEIVERMGVWPEVERAGYHIDELRLVDLHGERIGGFDPGSGAPGVSLTRGDLATILYRALDGRVGTMFDNAVTRLEPGRAGVLVHFERSLPRWFDLVIGADGLHSTVRRLAFGPDEVFVKDLGYTAAAFAVSGYRPRDDAVYVAYAEPGREVVRFAMRDDRTMFLFVLAGDPDERPAGTPHAYVERACAGMQWECPQILAALPGADVLYFDRVRQVQMPTWSTGRIGLVGDAAFASSLPAGQGAALAVVGAYVLAGELAAAGDIAAGLRAYEHRLRRAITAKQVAARQLASTFAPRSGFGIWLRNLIARALSSPRAARLVFGKGLVERIALPDYPAFAEAPPRTSPVLQLRPTP